MRKDIDEKIKFGFRDGIGLLLMQAVTSLLMICLVVVLAGSLVESCVRSSHKTTKTVKVHKYRTHGASSGYAAATDKDEDNSDIIFWYIIFSMNNNACYYYSSPVQISSYATINFTYSTSKLKVEEEEEIGEDEVSEADLSPDDQTEIGEDETVTTTEEDVEAAPAETTPAEESPSAAPSESNSGSESGSGSSGDSGGGDSGGDGGGDGD